jgi:hypothetical protein
MTSWKSVLRLEGMKCEKCSREATHIISKGYYYFIFFSATEHPVCEKHRLTTLIEEEELF